MSTLSVFKSTISEVNYIMGNGKALMFKNHRFLTDRPDEIKELQNEISLGHPHISQDPNELTIDSEMVDPMNALRHKIIAEYLAKEAAATNPENDMGTSNQQQLKPASSSDLAAAAAGAGPTSTGARLANLANIVKATS